MARLAPPLTLKIGLETVGTDCSSGSNGGSNSSTLLITLTTIATEVPSRALHAEVIVSELGNPAMAAARSARPPC